jgi:hypothetical protein
LWVAKSSVSTDDLHPGSIQHPWESRGRIKTAINNHIGRGQSRSHKGQTQNSQDKNSPPHIGNFSHISAILATTKQATFWLKASSDSGLNGK